jgi:hypothetical protein
MAPRGGAPLLLAALAAALGLTVAAAQAQGFETRVFEADDGARIAYTVRSHGTGVQSPKPGAVLAPDSALNTMRLLSLHLSTGDIESAALLSNSPRRRFEVLRDYRDSVGAEEFKRVFAQYFDPQNRLLAEVAIGDHTLLVWELRDEVAHQTYVAGQYFVKIEDRTLIDDIPNPTRSQLRRILQAWRDGKLGR